MLNFEVVATLKKWVCLPATCTYRGKPRVGHIAAVKQGPAIRTEDKVEFEYANDPDGTVYVDWLEKGAGKTKTFRWEYVTDFRLSKGDEPPAVPDNPQQIDSVLVRPWRIMEVKNA